MTKPNGIWVNCAHCNNPFYIQGHRIGRAKFCSMECLWAGRTPRIDPPTGDIATCEYCGKHFYVQPHRIEKVRFCSRKCMGLILINEKRDALLQANLTHGQSRTDPETGKRAKSPEYRAWEGMKNRCENQLWYVENNIKVCWKWRYNFEAFVDDMGPKPSPLHSLDRYPNAYGDYEPRNCRWATSDEQAWSKRGKKQPTSQCETRSVSIHHAITNNRGPNQKLTVEQVREIRALEGTERRPSIARRYGINVWHVRDIQKRRTWAWLE